MRFIGVVETTWFVERLESSEIVAAAMLPWNQVFDRYKEKGAEGAEFGRKRGICP
jgi:hypothetical protein